MHCDYGTVEYEKVPWNVIIGPCNVIMGQCNVIMGKWNVNRGPRNVLWDRGM